MLKQLNHCMQLIEQYLDSPDTMEQIAQQSQWPMLDIKQVFFYLTGMSLVEYIKNRKLSLATQKLLTGKSVTETAFESGYQSVDGFTRAYKKFSGMLPSEVYQKQRGRRFEPIQFKITVHGGNQMEYQLIEKPAFTFAGVSKRVKMQFEGVNQEIVALAQSITETQRNLMHQLKNGEPNEILNISYQADRQFLAEEGQLTHMLGVITQERNLPEVLDYLEMPASTWAVFPNEGPFPETLQQTMANIYTDWLVNHDYQLADSLSFSFTKMDPEKSGFAYSEIWIPVKK